MYLCMSRRDLLFLVYVEQREGVQMGEFWKTSGSQYLIKFHILTCFKSIITINVELDIFFFRCTRKSCVGHIRFFYFSTTLWNEELS
ncbi:hypothetical protein O3M35_010284 [Rhynocoris fuscipes]|uniref:Uncharacterized protein n=1 Tax=Rhynocoris fuscipes TaxID=488301 RepID=A0AAW1CZC4_9HEMI